MENKKQFYLSQVQMAVLAFYDRYKYLIIRLSNATKVENTDLRYELIERLDSVLQEARDRFGPHAMYLVEALDQIMHINRELQSRRPTTFEMIREAIGDEAHGLSNLQLLKANRRKMKKTFTPPVYPHFKQVPVSTQEF